MPYKITTSKGIIEGKTDAQGLTNVMHSELEEEAKIELQHKNAPNEAASDGEVAEEFNFNEI